MEKEEIPESIWESALVCEKNDIHYHRMDVICVRVLRDYSKA